MTNATSITVAGNKALCRSGAALGGLMALFVACLSCGAVGDERQAAATVGMEGICFLPYDGRALEAKQVDDSGPIVVRVSPTASKAPSAGSNSRQAGYELHYIATRPGIYDLRDWLVRADGLPLTGVGPLNVNIVSVLPADDDGALASSPGPTLPAFWPYRWLLAVGIGVWTTLLLWQLPRKARAPTPSAANQPAPTTLADQMRPLIAAAVAGSLGSEDLARLESLLHRHWRRRLALDGCSADEGLRRMRRHPEAGRLLRQLEEWLYKPAARRQVDVAAILAPYQNQAALA